MLRSVEILIQLGSWSGVWVLIAGLEAGCLPRKQTALYYAVSPFRKLGV